MRLIKTIATMITVLGLSACASVTATNNTTRSATSGTTAGQVAAQPTYRVVDINVAVPRTLTVSEANSYYPKGDIVWREDPMGDRHAQVKAIFDDALQRGTQEMNGLVPVVLDVEVLRFHALTEKTRYSVGGVHSITFALSLRNANTGLALADRRVIEADLQGFGGQQAIDAVRKGQTQKVRITAHLANVIRTELETPSGYKNERLGLVQVLNRF